MCFDSACYIIWYGFFQINDIVADITIAFILQKLKKLVFLTEHINFMRFI